MNMNNPNRFGMSMYTLKDPIAIGIAIAFVFGDSRVVPRTAQN